MSTLTAKIQLRRDTAANWATNDPILAAGEVAFTSDLFYTSTDQQRFKIGDGVQTWSQLDYVPEGGASAYPENLFLTVVNKTTDNLLASEYKVLKVITAQGQRLAVDYALADSDSNSADTIGVVFENINNNQSGKLTVIGEVTGINTTGSLQGETWADGDALFLSATTPGGITKVKPTAPDHGVRLGYVVYAHANQGKIYVKIDNGYEIGELHDCYLPTPTNNDGIFWSSGTTRYENKSITQALGYTPSYVVFKNTTLIQGTTNSVIYSTDLTGKIKADDFLNLKMRISSTVSAANKTLRVYLNTSNTVVGATQIAFYTFTTSSKLFERDIIINNTNQTLTLHAFNFQTDNIHGTTISDLRMSTINFNFSSNTFILFTMEGITTETFYSPYIIMTKI